MSVGGCGGRGEGDMCDVYVCAMCLCIHHVVCVYIMLSVCTCTAAGCQCGIGSFILQ